MYGGSIDGCFPALASSYLLRYNSTTIFDIMFKYTVQDTGVSVISSDAVRVCFCKYSVPGCSTVHYDVAVYPGDDVNLNIVTVGQRYGTTTGRVIVNEVVNNISVAKQWLPWKEKCSTLMYTITYNHHRVTYLYLSADTSTCRSFLHILPSSFINTTVKVKILDCPPGFQLSQELGKCVCDPAVLDTSSSATCNVSTQTITKRDNTWLGYDDQHHCVIGVENCPFDYCSKENSVIFTISEPDSQCASNRSGYLCGKCREGTSLILGANECRVCSNSFLTLVIIFGVAGILLVALLLLLNFTAAVGLINGLIFFANVVKLNETAYFPNGQVYVLSQFISWINLDWGIETCLYNGMDAHSKIWLQFVFPFYILVLTVMVILIARYSGPFSRFIGNNAVPVLATLILLSYTKLIRTITLALSYQTVTCEDAFTFATWKVDPNVEYLSLKHSLLLAFAVVVLVLFVLPFTLVLLFNPLIQVSLTRYKWFNKYWFKFKPFLDAYNGPYRDRFGFWTGVLLLMRIVLLFMASFTISPSTVLAGVITVVAITVSLSAWLGGVYKKRGLNIMEVWFLMLLLVMSGVANSSYGYIGTIVCVTLCIMTSLVIVVLHGIRKITQRNKHSTRPRPKYIPLPMEDEDDIAIRETLIYDNY